MEDPPQINRSYQDISEPYKFKRRRSSRGPEIDPSSELFLVTGGSGFIGRHLVDYLLKAGYRVRVLDIVQIHPDERLERFYVGDVRNLSDVLQACDGVTCIFHAAGLTRPWLHSSQYIEVNVTGTENIIKAARHHNVTKIVYTSSTFVVFEGSNIQNGDESLKYAEHPLDHYSRSKQKAELTILRANKTKTDKGETIFTCSLRPHNVFGPRDTHFIAQMVQRARTGDITHMIGEGHNVTDFTYVDNVVYAHVLAASALKPRSPVPGQVYFITNGEPTLFWDFVGRVLESTGCARPTKAVSFTVAYLLAWLMEMIYAFIGWSGLWKPVLSRKMVVTTCCHHWFDHSKATRDFNYLPIVTLAEGIKRTAEYMNDLTRVTDTD